MFCDDRHVIYSEQKAGGSHIGPQFKKNSQTLDPQLPSVDGSPARLQKFGYTNVSFSFFTEDTRGTIELANEELKNLISASM